MVNEGVIDERKNKISGAGMRRVYFFTLLALQILLFPIVIFGVGDYHWEVSYGIIISCFVTSLIFVKKETQALLQCGALFFTCIADYFLILIGKHRLIAMCFFLTVQLFYAARTLFLTKSRKERLVNVILRLGASAFGAALVFMVLGEKAEALFVISLIYYVNLLISVVFAFLHFKENNLLAIGLLLFSLCDLTIGLNELIDIFSLTSDHIVYKIVHVPIALESVFYHPSQILLSVSGRKFTKNVDPL